VRPKLPFILNVRVVLVGTGIDRGILCWHVCIGIEVSPIALLNRKRNSRQSGDYLLQIVDVDRGGCRARNRVAGSIIHCGWNIVEAARVSATNAACIEKNARRQDRTAEEAAAVVVDVETAVDSGAQ